MKKKIRGADIEINTDLPYVVKGDGADGAIRVVEIDSDDEGSLEVYVGEGEEVIVSRLGAGAGNCMLDGPGVGHVFRAGSGEGLARRSGDGDGSAFRMNSGDGDALRTGEGNGDAKRNGTGNGHAHRLGGGRGDAHREGPGDGDARRADSGKGHAVRKGEGNGNAVRLGKGSGDARRYHDGGGHAVRIGSGNGGPYRLGGGSGGEFATPDNTLADWERFVVRLVESDYGDIGRQEEMEISAGRFVRKAQEFLDYGTAEEHLERLAEVLASSPVLARFRTRGWAGDQVMHQAVEGAIFSKLYDAALDAVQRRHAAAALEEADARVRDAGTFSLDDLRADVVQRVHLEREEITGHIEAGRRFAPGDMGSRIVEESLMAAGLGPGVTSQGHGAMAMRVMVRMFAEEQSLWELGATGATLGEQIRNALVAGLSRTAGEEIDSLVGQTLDDAAETGSAAAP